MLKTLTPAPQTPFRSHLRAPRRRAPEAIHQDSLHLALERDVVREDAGPALRGRLERLAPFLAAEYEEQECFGGLYAEVLEAMPGLARRVDSLRADHQEILRVLGRLIDLLEVEPVNSEAAWGLRRRLSALMREVRHEEERLLLEASLQDLGGEGG